MSCNSRGGCTTTQTAILQLQGDVEVRHPEDLRPLIDERSESARALKRVEAAKSSSANYRLVALAGALGFLILRYPRHPDRERGLVHLRWRHEPRRRARRQHRHLDQKRRHPRGSSIQTYDHYDESLLQRLNLCVRGLAIAPCEMDTPGTMSIPVDGAESAVQGLPQR